MSKEEIKLKALEYLETHNIDIENLKECDAYNENYFLKWHFNEGMDTHNEMFVDDLFQGIIDLVEKNNK
jgi:hypothetical protein